MERITIIGVSPVGASIGLALMARNLRNTEVVITSRERSVMSAVSKLNAAHTTVSGLRSAVDGAQLIVLDVPVSEMREIMEAIGPTLEPDAVVTDTTNIKGPVMKWASEYLRPDASFVGGHPLLKKIPESVEDADASIFKDAKYTITPTDDVDDHAIRTVVGLVDAIGAQPLFLDPAEHDSYAAAMYHLPMIMSSAFVTTTAGSEGWREMHRLADTQFDSFGRHATNDPLDNEAVCIANPEAIVHWVDQLILELYNYRNEIKEGDDALVDRFARAYEFKAKWEANAVIPNNSPVLPTAGESMMTAMFGSKLSERLRTLRAKEDDSDNKLSRIRKDR